MDLTRPSPNNGVQPTAGAAVFPMLSLTPTRHPQSTPPPQRSADLDRPLKMKPPHQIPITIAVLALATLTG